MEISLELIERLNNINVIGVTGEAHGWSAVAVRCVLTGCSAHVCISGKKKQANCEVMKKIS